MNERYLWKAVLCTAFLLTFQGLPPAASAQVAISPVRVDLSDGHDKDVIRVSSQSDSTLSYQVEVVSWSQSGEQREVYAPTEDILAVPPLFTLEPGDEQVVRIGMLIEADAAKEGAYRMFITELAAPREEKSETTGVKMRLRRGVQRPGLPHDGGDGVCRAGDPERPEHPRGGGVPAPGDRGRARALAVVLRVPQLPRPGHP